MFPVKNYKSNRSFSCKDPRLAFSFLPAERFEIFTASFTSRIFIRGHKGQNSTGTRCGGFLALESRCRGFLVSESLCRGFLFSEKMPWNHDVVAYLSPFLDAVFLWPWNLDVVVFWSSNLDVVAFWSWNLDVVFFWSWNLDVVFFWSWNLDVVAFWSWNLNVVVYVSLRPRFRFH